MADVKKAYRILVKVWHPDRFKGDETLKMSAQQKLQNINAAYTLLTSRTDTLPRKPKHVNAAQQPQGEQGAAKTESPAGLTPEFERYLARSMRIRRTLSLLLKGCVLLFAIVIGRYVWIAFDLPGLSSGDVHRVYDAGVDNVAPELQGPFQRFLLAFDHDLMKLGLTGPAASLKTAMQPEGDAAKADQSPQAEAALNGKSAKKQSGKAQTTAPASPSRVIHSFITIGSTRDEVLAQQGPPTSSSEDKIVYGRSELDLKDGAVVGWRIDPVSNPIRVKLWPEHPVDTSQSFFTVDSTKDDVLVVQGTPTAFSNDKFEYGGSKVYFRNNRVVSWKDDLSTTPLRARNP
jgi:hypothetical protein